MNLFLFALFAFTAIFALFLLLVIVRVGLGLANFSNTLSAFVNLAAFAALATVAVWSGQQVFA